MTAFEIDASHLSDDTWPEDAGNAESQNTRYQSVLLVRKEVLENWAAGLVVGGFVLLGFMLPIVL
ncbi:MAG TPA: hypothetical protein VGC80_10145 [Acetobacteraceae bacterium]|jgi:hypothetical protein